MKLFPLFLLCSVATVLHSAEPLRVGVAGLTHTHVHWLLGRAERGDVQIVGIAEPNRDLALRYLKQHGLPESLLYPSLEAMIAGAKPEAVTAFGSIYEHLAVVEACAPKGIHVMVEKPLAVNREHARRMAALAREHGIHLLTNYETTWYASNHRAQALLHEGKLGRLRKVVVHDGDGVARATHRPGARHPSTELPGSRSRMTPRTFRGVSFSGRGSTTHPAARFRIATLQHPAR